MKLKRIIVDGEEVMISTGINHSEIENNDDLLKQDKKIDNDAVLDQDTVDLTEVINKIRNVGDNNE